MRKVLSLVLVLALVLGSFSMAFAATPKDVVGTPNEQAVTILMGLGVVNGYADGTFKPAGIVTRAEMAKLIVAALGLTDYATGTTTMFSDMAGATWAQGFVSYATGLGIIKGYPDGTFKPSQTVSYPEAAAMIVRALGYTDASLLPAMWPANYVVKAKALGILDGIKSTVGGANRGDIAEMLYNALTVKIGSTDVDNKWSANQSVASDPADNMLVRLGAKVNDANDGDAGVIYGDEDTMINLVSFIGQYADTYTIDGDIVAVDVLSETITGDFDVNGVATTGAGIFNTSTADDTDYTATAAVAGNHIPFFWNGVEEPTNSHHAYYSLDTISSATHHANVAVDLTNKRIDATYAANFWVVSDSGLFTADDAATIADDQMLLGNDFLLDSSDAIDANSFMLLGAASLKDIKVDNVVYVYDGWHDAGIKKIAVGTEVVKGKVTKVSSDGADYTIGGKVYSIAVDADGDDTTTIAIGETGTARLDYYGDVYDWSADDATADNYAVVITTAPAVSSLDSDRIKLETKDGTEQVFTVDSDAYATGQSLANLVTGDLVVFSTDKNGVIDDIIEKDWVDPSTDGKLSANRTIYLSQVVDPAVVVFTVNADGNFSVAKLASVTTDSTLANAKYFADSKIEVMLINADFAGASDSMFAVINDVSTAINADGDTVKYVEGFVKGKAYAAYTDGTSDTVMAVSGTARLYDLTVDANGVITKVAPIVNATGVEAWIGSKTVVEKDGSYLVKLDVNGTTGNTLDDIWVSIDSAAVVYQLDASAKEYTLKTISAVKTGSVVTLWQVDADSTVYDIVIVEVL